MGAKGDIMENKKYKITILLLIILILLIIYFLKIGKVTEKEVIVPTGNIDVFDIGINCNCEKEEKCIYTDKNNKPIPVFKEEYVEHFEDYEGEVLGNVYVDDSVGNYVYLQRLEIFKNAAFQMEEKIAPGSSNVYQFVVHNSTNARIKYDINMIEVNDKNITMLYRLKKNDSYVISNWVSVNDLKNITSTLDSSNSDTYQLEWKWPYEGNDNIDTLAGTSIDSNYKLNINVSFRAIV